MAGYALMCKELLGLEVSLATSDAGCDDISFRKFFISRCMIEFDEAYDKNAKFIEPCDEMLADQVNRSLF